MKHLILALTLIAAPAYAGGPVVTPEEPEVITPERQNILPLIIGLLILGAIAGGGDKEEPKPCGKVSGGC